MGRGGRSSCYTRLQFLVPARLRDDARLGISGEISVGYLLTEPEPGTTRLVRCGIKRRAEGTVGAAASNV